MKTMNLKIDDNFFPHFKAMIDSLVKDQKVEVIENTIYDFEAKFPKSLLVNNTQEVQDRVYEAEKRINNGHYITEDEYNKSMDEFFKVELGISR